MSTKRYQVFISSTFTDLKDERQKVIQAVMEMDCMPAGMELFPAVDQEQLDFIKTVIDDSDYYVIILGGRYGSTNSEGIGYTEAEYDYAVEKGIKVIALVHANPDMLPAIKSEVSDEARDKLKAFRTKLLTNRLARMWDIAAELPGLVVLSLTKTIRTYPAIGWVRGDQTSSQEALTKISELTIENSELREEVRALKRSESYSPPVNIAKGSENYQITGRYSVRRANGIQSYDLHYIKSWDHIFNLVGMKIRKSVTIEYAKVELQNAIKEEQGYFSCTIKMSDVETIGAQFSALGLITTRVANSTKGSSHLWWQLTNEGIRYWNELRLVRSKNEAPASIDEP